MGYRNNKCIALGMLKTEFLDPGTELEIDVYGTRRKAVVQPDAPLWDPSNERIRA